MMVTPNMNSAAKAMGVPTPKPTPIAPRPIVTPAAAPQGRLNMTTKLPELPHMHSGGPVPADGNYALQAGEHVLTQPQAKMARRHALMSIGMSRLSQPSQPSTAGEPKKMDATAKKPEKKVTNDIKIRPGKSADKKVKVK